MSTATNASKATKTSKASKASRTAQAAATTAAVDAPLTTVPAVDAPVAGPDTRRKVRPATFHETDVLALAGAAACSAGLTWLLFEQFAPFSGFLGWVFVGWVLFVAAYALLVSMDQEGQAVKDRVVAVVIHSIAFLLLLGLVFVIGYVLFRGIEAVRHLNFFTQDMSITQPKDPLDRGGVLHGIIGTLWMISIALVITVPLGLLTAVFLNEVRGPFPRFVRTIVEAMTALPSVIAGLFIFSTYILAFGFPKSGFAAAMALSIMMLPIVIRAADVVIRLVPGNLREASLALGAGRWRTVLFVVLPTARSGLATAIILGTARGIGETSPVLLTAGSTALVNLNPLSGPMVSLPLLAFQMFQFPFETMRARSFGAAATLLALVLGLFITARSIGGRSAGDLTARQRRHRQEQSAADVERYLARARGDWTDVPAAGAGVGALVDMLRSGARVPARPPSVSARGSRRGWGGLPGGRASADADPGAAKAHEAKEPVDGPKEQTP